MNEFALNLKSLFHSDWSQGSYDIFDVVSCHKYCSWATGKIAKKKNQQIIKYRYSDYSIAIVQFWRIMLPQVPVGTV